MSIRLSLFLAVTVFLLAFLVATYHLTRESLWYDEGWTAWAVHDEEPIPTTSFETLRFIWGSITTTLEHVRSDVHPPLYFLLLDVWVLLAGETVFALRFFSVLCGLVALAATGAVGRRLFDREAGLLAMLVLGSASFFVYYTREARMYMLLVALAALTTWFYLRWLGRPNWTRTGLYGLALALLLYTHYGGALIVCTQVLHLFVSLRIRLRPRHGWPFMFALLLYVPWIPVVIQQIAANNGRPLAEALPTDWSVVAALWLILTSGHWAQYALPLLFWRPVRRWRDEGRAILLLLLWFLVTPVLLLALNAWLTPVFQIRYNIAVLPAGALFMAWMLRHIRLPQRIYGQLLSVPLVIFLVGWLAYTQLTMYSEFWPDKPRWSEAAAQMASLRPPLEPAVFDVNPANVAAYYARQDQLRTGISIDVAWRDHTPEEMRTLALKLENAPAVWAVMRSDMPTTWDLVSALLDGRGVGYRDTVMNVVFYRFDEETQELLRFRFGEALRYESGIGHQLYARAGEAFCLPVDLRFTVLEAVGRDYTVEVYLTRGYNTVSAYWSRPLLSYAPDETLSLDGMGATPCLDIPADEPAGPHHLRLSVRQQGVLLPLIENYNLYWGTALVFAVVSVE